MAEGQEWAQEAQNGGTSEAGGFMWGSVQSGGSLFMKWLFGKDQFTLDSNFSKFW